MALFYKEGASRLYHAGSPKLDTTSTGITVTGPVSATTGSFSGNVGIGTPSNANHALEVNGRLHTSSYITAVTQQNVKLVFANHLAMTGNRVTLAAEKRGLGGYESIIHICALRNGNSAARNLNTLNKRR